MQTIIKILFTAISVLLFSSCAAANADTPSSHNGYSVMIGADAENLLLVHDNDVIILDAEYLTVDDISAIHQNDNRKIYSYLNIGSVEDFRKCYDEFLPYALGDYENWDNEKWVDVSEEKWQEYISSAASELMSKGVDGLFVDNGDVYYNFPTEDIFSGLVEIFTEFDTAGIDVIVNGSDTFVRESINRNILPECISGVNQETVFSSINFENGTFGRNGTEEREYFIEYIKLCHNNGLDVYLTEYSTDKKLISEIQEYCTEKGYYYYISDDLELK